MANYKVVDADQLDANLKSVADSIREKAGTADSLEFPAGFKQAVDDIQAGGEPEKPYIDSSKLIDFSYFFSKKTAKSNYEKPTRPDISLLKDIDTSNGIIFQGMFQNFSDIDYYLDIPYLDTSNGEIFDLMFYNTKCKTIPDLNTSKGISFYQMFFNNYDIETCPALDTKNGTEFYGMFYNCNRLKTVHGELDFGNATRLQSAFANCKNLQEVRFKSIRVFDNNLGFSACSNLTVESLLSILNALSDNTAIATTYTVHLGSANIAKLTFEQLSIAYDKNIDLD